MAAQVRPAYLWLAGAAVARDDVEVCIAPVTVRGLLRALAARLIVVLVLLLVGVLPGKLPVTLLLKLGLAHTVLFTHNPTECTPGAVTYNPTECAPGAVASLSAHQELLHTSPLSADQKHH